MKEVNNPQIHINKQIFFVKICNNSDKIKIEDFKKKIDEQDYRIVCLNTNLEKQSLYINTLKKLICEKNLNVKKLKNSNCDQTQKL